LSMFIQTRILGKRKTIRDQRQSIKVEIENPKLNNQSSIEINLDSPLVYNERYLWNHGYSFLLLVVENDCKPNQGPIRE
jgi:hypothetical protein